MQKSSSRRTTSPKPIEMLMEDHRKVQKMFKQYEKMKDQDDEQGKRELVEQACAELKVHTAIEDEIFYPAARDVLDDPELVEEAAVEHASAKELIAKLEGMDSVDETYDATFSVLGEYVNHHIREEQDEMFPKVKKGKLDWDALAAEMQQRKEQLQEEMGFSGAEDESEAGSEKRAPQSAGREAARNRRSPAGR